MQQPPNHEPVEKNQLSDDKKRMGRSVPMVLMFFCYVFGTVSLFLGIALGLVFRNSKTILTDASKVYLFNEKVRKHGRNIMILSSIFSALDVVVTIVILIIGYNNPETFMDMFDIPK